MLRPRCFADPSYAAEPGIFRSSSAEGREEERSITILAGENLTDAELSINNIGMISIYAWT
jgi:hypothetical protein